MNDRDKELLETAIELGKKARDVLRKQMKAGSRPKDFDLLHRWADDVHRLEKHLAQGGN